MYSCPALLQLYYAHHEGAMCTPAAICMLQETECFNMLLCAEAPLLHMERLLPSMQLEPLQLLLVTAQVISSVPYAHGVMMITISVLAQQ
jgi:hypothetical protein